MFDWIEIRLQKFSKNTQSKIDDIDNYTNRALDAVYKGKDGKTKTGILGAVNNAVNAVRKERSLNEQAAVKYQKQADKVAKQTGLDQPTLNGILGGRLDISSYSENTQKKIREYQKWYILCHFM